MGHDWAVLAAIGGVVWLASFAIFQGQGDGLVASAFTALGVLAGVKVALREAAKKNG